MSLGNGSIVIDEAQPNVKIRSLTSKSYHVRCQSKLQPRNQTFEVAKPATLQESKTWVPVLPPVKRHRDLINRSKISSAERLLAKEEDLSRLRKKKQELQALSHRIEHWYFLTGSKVSKR